MFLLINVAVYVAGLYLYWRWTVNDGWETAKPQFLFVGIGGLVILFFQLIITIWPLPEVPNDPDSGSLPGWLLIIEIVLILIVRPTFTPGKPPRY